MSKEVPESHPRHRSLITRERVVKGVEKGITSVHGLIAQGRGEAFDYLIGEKTNDFAKKAIEAAAAFMLLAEKPVISVNGNAAALVADDLVELSRVAGAALEVNIFHTSKKRERAIKREFKRRGVKILMPSKKHKIEHIEHNRKFVNKEGILKADVVFVPLEDGDRCEALIKNEKSVITIDLNPLSRTSQTATITIVDNIIRAMKVMNETALHMRGKSRKQLERIVKNYNNKAVLKMARERIRKDF
jgi:4-phosphopantoate--beta-alanine ligase